MEHETQPYIESKQPEGLFCVFLHVFTVLYELFYVYRHPFLPAPFGSWKLLSRCVPTSWSLRRAWLLVSPWPASPLKGGRWRCEVLAVRVRTHGVWVFSEGFPLAKVRRSFESIFWASELRLVLVGV